MGDAQSAGALRDSELQELIQPSFEDGGSKGAEQ
jgi:hypothetical protein